MKILFLDIDGVLNSTRTSVAFGGYPHELEHQASFDQVAIGLIQRLCQSSVVKVVLSSAWRHTNTSEAVGKAFGLPIIDSTLYLIGKCRGAEIAEWLARHPEVETYAIVDDYADMLPEQASHFVRTDPHDGLLWADYQKICGILGEDAYAHQPRLRNWMTEPSLDWPDEDNSKVAK